MMDKPTEDEFIAGSVLPFKGFDGVGRTVRFVRDPQLGVSYLEFTGDVGKGPRKPITSELNARTFYMNCDLAAPA